MTTERDRLFKSYRAFLPSEISREPDSRTPGEIAASEREDPRRSRTSYFLRLEREVARRVDTNSLLEGDERRNIVDVPDASLVPAVARTGAEWVREILARPIDMVTERCFNVVVQDDREDDDMSTATMEAPKAAAVKKAKTTKSKTKPKSAKKPSKATKKLAKAARPKKGKGTEREQTCVNIPIPVKKALDQKAKKLGTSRSRLMIEAIAKAVGVKLPKKAG